MKISYYDLLGDQQRHTMDAELTTDHPASSYGQPVLLIGDGDPLDYTSWMLLDYRVEEIAEDEVEPMRAWLSGMYVSAGIEGITNWEQANAASDETISRVMSELGSRTSPRKTAAARANASKPPKPGKKPRGRPRKPKAD